MSVLWRVMTEIRVQPDDFAGGNTNGFINVITWAESAEHACERLANYIGGFDWHIVEVDSVVPVNDLIQCSEEMEDMIIRAKDNPIAIILGTFHSYKVN